MSVQLKIADADGLYYLWRWEHALHEPRMIMLPRELVRDTLDALAQAVPTPLPGESIEQALDRALARGPLLDRDREAELATRLAATLLPQRLAVELAEFIEQGVRPRLRIAPSPSLGQVPWEALRVDDGVRLVDLVDVSVLPPATVRNSTARVVSPPGGHVVRVLDPKVPGLGSVLGEAKSLRALGSPVQTSDLTEQWLVEQLPGAARLLYVGHVTTGGHALDARLHLSSGPLGAADLVTRRLPNRVALIACDSGGEVRFAEPAGLVTAAVQAGAQYVTAARWTLPTDAGLRRFVAPDLPEAFGTAVVAIDTAQAAHDPVVALGAWQRSMARGWEDTGRPEFSPVIWAAFATAQA